MKKAHLRYWTIALMDSSKTALTYKGVTYRYNVNTLTFERIQGGLIVGRYTTLKQALNGTTPLSEQDVLQGMSTRAKQLTEHVPDSLIKTIVERFSEFEPKLRILFTHLYFCKA